MKSKVTAAVALVSKHLPLIIAGVLICVNALIDANIITLPANIASFVNIFLVAFNLGVLHTRQQAQK